MRRCLYGMPKAACRDLQHFTIGTKYSHAREVEEVEKVRLVHLLGGSGHIHPSSPSVVNSSGGLYA